MDQEITEGAPTRGSPMEEILNPDYEDFDQTANWQRAVVESYTLISVLTKKG